MAQSECKGHCIFLLTPHARNLVVPIDGRLKAEHLDPNHIPLEGMTPDERTSTSSRPLYIDDQSHIDWQIIPSKGKLEMNGLRS